MAGEIEMDDATLEALKGSIKKWEDIVAGTGVDSGADNCPLCGLFNNTESEPMCVGCPVMNQTGKDGCAGTPYVEWCKQQVKSFDFPHKAKTDGQIAAAKAEVEFLRRLLPPQSSTIRPGE